MTGEHAPAVAMPMNRQRAALPQRAHSRQTDVVQADHDTGSSGLDHAVVMTSHRIELVGDIHRIHQLATGLISKLIDLAHHATDSLSGEASGADRPSTRRP